MRSETLPGVLFFTSANVLGGAILIPGAVVLGGVLYIPGALLLRGAVLLNDAQQLSDASPPHGAHPATSFILFLHITPLPLFNLRCVIAVLFFRHFSFVLQSSLLSLHAFADSVYKTTDKG